MAPLRPANASLKSNLGTDSEHTLHAHSIYCAQILVHIQQNLYNNKTCPFAEHAPQNQLQVCLQIIKDNHGVLCI